MAQSPSPPLAAAGSSQSQIHWQIVFSGYRPIGSPLSGSAVISDTGLSDIHELTFSRLGGELSPDGRSIAYDNYSSSNRGIYVAEPDGSKPKEVISNDKYCTDIRWSPDSTKLSCVNQKDRSLHILDIARNSDTVIANTEGADWHWWSPDGKEIVYGKFQGRAREGGVARLLYITDLKGNSRQLTFARDFQPCYLGHNLIDTFAPAWSPKGDAIAFNQGECLFVVSPTGNNLRQLTAPQYALRPPANIAVTGAYNPRWSPDGRWIVFGAGALCQIADGALLKRISPDGNLVVEIGRLPYCGGPFSVAPLRR